MAFGYLFLVVDGIKQCLCLLERKETAVPIVIFDQFSTSVGLACPAVFVENTSFLPIVDLPLKANDEPRVCLGVNRGSILHEQLGEPSYEWVYICGRKRFEDG